KANGILGFDIKTICFTGPEDVLTATLYSQPAIFVTSMAVLNVLIEKIKGSPVGGEGMEFFAPEEIRLAGELAMGLSLGEVTALAASGGVSFADGVKLVQKRAEFMEQAAKKEEGKMASVMGLSLEKVEELCKGLGCQVANLNCPDQVVISGPASVIDLAADLAANMGAKKTIVLKVSGAFHSRLMLPAKENFKKVLKDIAIKEPAIDFISNIDAENTKDAEKIRENLANQLDNRTLWEASVRKVIGCGITDFLEIGPGSVLKGLARRIDKSISVTCLGTLSEINSFLAS
ncbi:MAG: ACP S-malonyltransferase, partial [Candidatus Omnitrophica bacterium]|nr:ACP S-malonyltransferase [Candidatus Omnitrophota bacterium]